MRVLRDPRNIRGGTRERCEVALVIMGCNTMAVSLMLAGNPKPRVFAHGFPLVICVLGNGISSLAMLIKSVIK